MSESRFHTVGRELPRKDSVAKVTGREVYPSDISLSHMLHARVLRSPYPHARIKHIDTRQAEEMGAICLTFADIPKIKYAERLLNVPDKLFKDRFVLADKARHVGEAVAAVCAETEELAQKALWAIEVSYELLPAVLDPITAMEPGSAQIQDTILIGDVQTYIENNIACRREFVEGDIDTGFAEADLIVEREYQTGRIYHAHLETKSVVCRPEPDGSLTVWATTQSIHNVRQLLGELFNIPLSKINVKRLSIGGAFGSSIQINSVIPICAALALKAGRAVKLVSTREEDMYDHCKYPSRTWLKLGVKRDGTLTGGHMKVVMDIGAHNTQAFSALGCMAGWWVSLYRLPHLKFEGIGVYTNKVPACAMRGFGNPQINFAVESLIDEVADRLGMDSVELRLKNYLGRGDTYWGQGPAVRSVIDSCGVEELLRRGAKMMNWENRPHPEAQTGRIRRGVGMARGFHTSGAGAPQPGDVIDYSGAMIKINEDGSVDIVTALTDCGGGSLDAVAKIVAEELGIPLHRVGISPVDTRTSVYDVLTHASRGVYCGGGAAHKVAGQVKQRLLQYAARVLEIEAKALKIRPDEALGQGIVYAEGVPEKTITVGEVAKIAQNKNWGTIAAVDSLRQVNCPPSFTAQFVEVEVDTKTGQVKIVRAVLGADIGTVINPKLAVGQVEGGFCQGLGYALIEDPGHTTESGELMGKGYLLDARLPTCNELPEVGRVDTFFVQTYEPSGPFGAKGIGEAALNPTAAAIANAIYNAIGTRFTDLPITPEKIKKALKETHRVWEAAQGLPFTARRHAQ